MEKIYTQGQGQKQKQQQMNFSVILSFTLAILSIFTIGTFAIVNNQGSGVSYAAPVPDSFKLTIPDTNGTENLAGITSYTAAGDEAINVPMYYANTVGDANHVFCIELNQDWEDGSQYAKTDLADDAGLMYIMNNSYASGVPITGGQKEVEIWATQAAIWLYKAERYPNEAKYKFGDGSETEGTTKMKMKSAITNASKFILRGGPNSGDSITATDESQKVINLVNKALQAEAISMKVSAANDQMKQTSDGKYYQTALITVAGTPANSLQSYDVTISGVDGVKLVDENGAEMAHTNIAAGKKFYLRIPASSVNGQAKTLKVGVNGNFKAYSYYTSAGKQTVIGPGNLVKPGGIDFEITGSPDTGMNAAQTIYFIGLIVLLCGVGIVYANAKPVESKQ